MGKKTCNTERLVTSIYKCKQYRTTNRFHFSCFERTNLPYFPPLREVGPMAASLCKLVVGIVVSRLRSKQHSSANFDLNRVNLSVSFPLSGMPKGHSSNHVELLEC